MPRIELVKQQVVPSGLEATFAAANADGYFFANENDVILEVVNAGGADITVTIVTPATKGGLAVADQAVVVTAGERRHIGRFDPKIYNRATTESVDPDRVYVNFSSVTSVTIALLEVV